MVEEPVIVTYTHPKERVLFSAARDANCFFHAYEAMWMLAGRNDVEPLAYYNRRMREFSDDGVTFNGAYGYRWRKAWCQDCGGMGFQGENTCETCNETRHGTDQLKILIDHLKANPMSRRAVLQMWDIENDLLRIDKTRDCCCNVCAFLSIREEHISDWVAGPGDIRRNCCKYLDMTVCNRSNDLVWGLAGANAAHFSVLLEYMAAHLGVEVGVYNQITNNLHVYTKRWEPEKWLADTTEAPMGQAPLVANPVVFDEELPRIVERHQKDALATQYQEPFFQLVAQPMFIAFHHYNRKDYRAALQVAESIDCPAWRFAAMQWLQRRAK